MRIALSFFQSLKDGKRQSITTPPPQNSDALEINALKVHVACNWSQGVILQLQIIVIKNVGTPNFQSAVFLRQLLSDK